MRFKLGKFSLVLVLFSIPSLIILGYHLFTDTKYLETGQPTLQAVRQRKTANIRSQMVQKPEMKNRIKLAVLLIEDVEASPENFVVTSKTDFVLDTGFRPLDVTYFLFFRSLDNYLKHAAEPFSNNTVGILTYLIKGEINPCRIYLENQHAYSYFDSYDYVISFNARMITARFIDVYNELVADRLAVVHPTFRWFSSSDRHLYPYDRRNGSCALVTLDNQGDSRYYAADIFGGSSTEVSQFCRAVLSCQSSETVGFDQPQFHQVANSYFVKNRPTLVLGGDFISAIGINDSPEKPAIIFKENPPATRFSSPYGQWVNTDFAFFEERQQKVSKIFHSIMDHYLDIASSALNSNSAAKFISYYCSLNDAECQNFGAIRGSASLLYLAMATGRIFDMNWEGSDEPIFLKNAELYQVSTKIYNDQLSRAMSIKEEILPLNETDDYHGTWPSVIGEMNWSSSFEAIAVLTVTTTRTHSLTLEIFANPTYQPALQSAIPVLPEYRSTIDHTIYLSAAIRILFGKTSNEVNTLVDEIIAKVAGSRERWDEAGKIGVQLRQICTVPGANGTCSQTTYSKDEVIKFAESIHDLIKEQVGLVPRFIFVTSPAGHKVTMAMQEQLDKLTEKEDNRIVVFDTSESFSNTKRTNRNDRGFVVSSFLDWYLLTKMDWLLISESHFGETASLFSLKPTHRYDTSRRVFRWYNLNITHTDPL